MTAHLLAEPCTCKHTNRISSHYAQSQPTTPRIGTRISLHLNHFVPIVETLKTRPSAPWLTNAPPRRAVEGWRRHPFIRCKMRTEKVARHVAASLREDAKLIGEKNLICYRPHLQNGTCRRICNFAQNESYFFNKKFLLLSDFSLTATNTNRQPKEPKEQLCANIDDSGGGHCLLGADDKERQEESSTLMANQTRHDVGKECMFHGPLSGKQCWPNTTKI